MSGEKKVLWITTAVVVAAVVALMVSSGLEEKLAPRPVAAWVAIQAEGAEVAVAGPLELAAGREFTLHAVLEAQSVSGETIYYTEAEALEIRGERIPTEALRRWQRPETLRVLWFTVEGISPYLELQALEGPESLRFQENFRSNWPMSWSIPGDLEPSAERLKPAAERSPASGFGTQRFHLRIEILGPESLIVPRDRFRTPGADDVWAEMEDFPKVTATLPGRLAAPSQLFGLTQIAVPDESEGATADLLRDWSRRRLAFSRATVMRGLMLGAGTSYADLGWTEVELTGTVAWGDEGGLPGDLIRVGERLVVLFEDRGTPGVLDYGDLCFDYDRGAHVRTLGDVFIGEGVVELGRLPREEGPAGGAG
jgi:hypothetical protein